MIQNGFIARTSRRFMKGNCRSEIQPFATDVTQLKLVPPRIPTGFRPEAQGCEERATLGHGSPMETNPNGVVTKTYFRLAGSSHNRVAVELISKRRPKVARSSQPWAGGHNPFGIEGGIPSPWASPIPWPIRPGEPRLVSPSLRHRPITLLRFHPSNPPSMAPQY